MHKLGIDATNIRSGGGLTHLIEFLAAAEPDLDEFSQVVIWGGEAIRHLPEKKWLKKRLVSSSDRNGVEKFRGMLQGIERQVLDEKCDMVFSPGGLFFSKRVPYVSMSQNMLPFEPKERARFPIGFTRARYALVRMLQLRSFQSAAGILFISEYARRTITRDFPRLALIPNRVVYHGVSGRFHGMRGRVRSSSGGRPVRVLYVSRINYYKHQWNVARAIEALNSRGIGCELRLVGGVARGMEKLERLTRSPFVVNVGDVDFGSIAEEYANADVFVFASSCENMPNILLEAMAVGVPIASSNMGPMPEVLSDAAIFFDPLDQQSIGSALEAIVVSSELREQLRMRGFKRVASFSWEKCARQTFAFLRRCIP